MSGYAPFVGQELLKNRIIYLAGDIDIDKASYVVSSLLVLNAQDRESDIHMYISSFGGAVEAGLAIYDCMHMIEAPVATYCIGVACSMAAWLLAAGEKGKRYATPNSKIMIHQISLNVSGPTRDVELDVKRFLEDQDIVIRTLAYHTGRSVEEIREKIHRNLWFKPEEAVEFGIIDKVLQLRKPWIGSKLPVSGKGKSKVK